MVANPRSRRKRAATVVRTPSRPVDWHEELLAQIRRVIRETDGEALEERKWKMPSKPAGVPVWSHGGILCVCDFLKASVRLTFPKGASLRDPMGRFNARLDSRTVRAIDIHQGETIDEDALKEWVRGAVALNASRSK
jgi:hypothetical protein